MGIINKIINKSKSLYEYLSLLMVILYAVLPAVMIADPPSWGKAFRAFATIETAVLLVCIFWCAVIFILKIFSFSFKTAMSDLKESVVGYFTGRRYAIMLLIMYILVVISAFLAPNAKRAFMGNDFRPDGVLMHSAFLALFVFSCAVRKGIFKKIIMTIYCVSFLLLSLIVAQQYFGVIGTAPGADTPEFLLPLKDLYTELGFRTGHFYKGLTATFYNLNHMGYYIAVCTMIFVAFLICADKLWKKIIFILLSGYSFWILIINNTFGCYLAVFATMVITLIVFAIKKCDTTRAVLPILVFVAVSVFTVLFPPPGGDSVVLSNFSTTTSDVKEIYNKDESASTAGSGRWDIWKNTLEMIAEKPVMGFGPDNLKSEYTAREVTVDRAHNEIMERAVSTGVPSAVFYATAILLAIIEAFKKRNFATVDGVSIAPLMAATTYFLSGLVGVFLFYTAGHLFIMLALIEAKEYSDKEIVQAEDGLILHDNEDNIIHNDDNTAEQEDL